MSKANADPRARMIFDPAELDYNFGSEHPLQPQRIVALMDLLETSGLWHSSDEHTKLPLHSATVEELSIAHATDYIAAVQTLSSFDREEALPNERAQLAIKYGFADGDTPILPNMHQVCSRIAGGTLVALNAVMGIPGDVAFSPQDE